MSRIGRLPVKLEDGVTAAYENNTVTVKGKLGSLQIRITNDAIDVKVEGNQVSVTRKNEDKATKAAHGMYRAIIANMAYGVKNGYKKELVVAGVGYKAQLSGKNLVLNIGFSHPVTVEPPQGITFECPDLTNIAVKGIDKDLVGQTASDIKAIRKPEPYHGYGIHYKNEVLIHKEGKANAKAAK
jgi:large subunit ribosomal protein L6